jgi:hypothetical protein
MALTANCELDRYVDQELRALPIKASTSVYKGALLGIDSGTGCVRGLVAGDAFAGISYEEMSNGTATDGAVKVRAYTVGDFEVPLGSAAQSNNGALVYASADDTFTLTSTDNSAVGRQVDAVGSDKIVLRIKSVFSL